MLSLDQSFVHEIVIYGSFIFSLSGSVYVDGSGERFELYKTLTVLYPVKDGLFVGPVATRRFNMAETVKKASAAKKPRATAAKKTAPKKSSTSNLMQMKASPEEVARLAHQYWVERGYQDGHDAEDWFRAEQELLGKAS